MASRGYLRENHLAFPITHSLRMRLCEELHKPRVFGESAHRILNERHVFRIHCSLA